MSDLQQLKEILRQTITAVNRARGLGRPPGQSNVVLDAEPILIASLQNGLSVRQSCLQAGIGKTAFYDELAKNESFADRIDKAEQYPLTKARQNIVKSVVSGNIADSWRLLERKDPEFKPKSDLTSDDKPLKTALVEFAGDDGNTQEQS